MEEEICPLKTFLKEFNDDQIQSPTSEEFMYTRVGNYTLDPEEVTGQVIDWVLNYLDKRKCPYSLALSIAKEAAQQVCTSFSTLSQNAEGCNSASVYAETISKVSAICKSFSNQANLKPSCSSKYVTSVFAIKNKRRKMEDRHVILHDLNAVLDIKDAPHQSYYAVFDGHSGIDAACYASSQLHINIAKHPEFLTDPAKAITEGYQITDLNFLNKCNRNNIKSGCTAVTALIRENTVYLAWLGDSQGVLVKDGLPVTITSPHRPDREDEKQRIESLGGHVSHMGTWRVNGLIAVTRAIGDPDQKRFLSSDPEMSVLKLDGTEDFLILACDGLWDGISPEDAIGILYRYLQDSPSDEPIDAVAAKLVHQSKIQGSEDNITAIVVFLRDIKDIKENCAKFVSSSFNIQSHDFMSMNGNTKNVDSEHGEEMPFPKPTVLELNAASSKKLKNAANVMSSTGFGSTSYNYQYVENASEVAFQSIESSSMEATQNAAASCFAPEATALSELPTPPIDDMLASQQFENFYSTDLYKDLSKSLHSSQIVDITSGGDTNPFQSPTLKSPSQPTDSFSADGSNMSLLDSENANKSNSEEKISTGEAVGIATSVVSTAIETAVKCLSSSETEESVPSQSPIKLNPYAKPFVMKSFFNSEEPESNTCSQASNEISESPGLIKEPKAEPDNQLMTDISSELSPESGLNKPVPEKSDVNLLDFDGMSSCIADNTVADFVSSQQGGQSVTDFVVGTESEFQSKVSYEQSSFSVTESSMSEKFCNQSGVENVITNDAFKTDVNIIDNPNEDLSKMIDTNLVPKTDVAQEPSPSKQFENPFTENKSLMNEVYCQKTKPEENKQSVSDSFIDNFDKLRLVSTSAENDAEAFATTVSENVNFNPFTSESSTHLSEQTKQLFSEDSVLSDNTKQPNLLDQNQNFESPYVSQSLPSEIESKHENTENCLLGSVTKEHLTVTNLLENSSNETLISESKIESNLSTFLPEVGFPAENQNLECSDMSLTSNSAISDGFKENLSEITSEKSVNIVESMNEISLLAKSLPVEPISLIDIKNELIPPEAEIISDPSVEESHAEEVAVDLKSLPVEIPEAEGVTEDVDSDSEKDGGWSYMKGNIVSGSKSKSDSKESKTLKSKEIKPSVTPKGRNGTSKPNLDLKSKVKTIAVDKTKTASPDKIKNISADKTKTVGSDKSKNVSTTDKTLVSVDKTKKAVTEKKLDIKTKVMKSSTLSATTKVTSERNPRPTGVSAIKKETSDTVKTTSLSRPTRPTTLLRPNASANKPTINTAPDRNATSRVTAKPKIDSKTTENRLPVNKTTSSALPKVQVGTSTKLMSSSIRSAPSRPATTISKTSTITKTSMQKSASSEPKPRQPASATSSTLRKPLQSKIHTTTVRNTNSEVKEIKDTVNKQISAKKPTTTGKTDSGSTLTNRRVASSSMKTTTTTTTTTRRMASGTARSEVSKKDMPKALGLKTSTSKQGPAKASQVPDKRKEENVQQVLSKTEETKNSLNVENDQKAVAEIVQVTEEKFILETTDKEVIKEKCEIVSVEENKNDSSLTNAEIPTEDKTPVVESMPEKL